MTGPSLQGHSGAESLSSASSTPSVCPSLITLSVSKAQEQGVRNKNTRQRQAPPWLCKKQDWSGHIGLVSQEGFPESNVYRLTDTLSYRVMWMSTVVWKRGSMCEWRRYQRVLKTETISHKTWRWETLHLPQTQLSLSLIHPQLSSCCQMCSSMWQNVLNPHC